MLNNKINSTTSHIKTKAATYPNLRDKSETFAFVPPTPRNTPSSSYENIGSTVKFYIPSSSSSENDSNEAICSTTQRRHTL